MFYFSWLDVGRLLLASYFLRVLSIWIEMIDTDIFMRFKILPYRLRDFINMMNPKYWELWFSIDDLIDNIVSDKG